MTALLPAKEKLARFSSLLFKHANPNGYVSLRAFPDASNDGKALFLEPISIGDPQFLAVVSERARQAAQWPKPAVFCPPIATFKTPQDGKAENILEGVALSVDCDKSPRAAYTTLARLLGLPTVTVRSGGEWTNPDTGEIEPKVHLHWRLKPPASTPEEHKLLREARRLAADLVDSDPTAASLVHPLRWPGSWHRKKDPPRLADIVSESENEIDLSEALHSLREAAGAHCVQSDTFSRENELEAENPEDVVSALRVIPNENLDWAAWNNIGLATWGATAGSEDGARAFAEWSAKATKNDPEATAARWRHYQTSPPDRIGFGTLVHLARQYSPGWMPIGRGNTTDKPAQFKALSKREFISDFVPPDYLLDGILQRKFVYSLTAQTGHGKTAVALQIARLVGGSKRQGAALGRHAAEHGQVVYFAGENPDDLRMRVIGDEALCNDDSDRIWFIPGTFSIEGMRAKIEAEMQRLGGVDLIIVDTSAAYFNGKDELSNTEMGAHARLLRTLTTLPGGPCVLVLCHPVKHVTDPSQLLPRGGGAFLAEVDGNLTLWKHDGTLLDLHHSDKLRGPGFEPITLRLETVSTTRLTDKKGRLIPTVKAVWISDAETDRETEHARGDEDTLLRAMLTPGLSIAKLAEACGWLTSKHEPHKSKVDRTMKRLADAKLAKKDRGTWTLNEAGKKAAQAAASAAAAREHTAHRYPT